MAHPLQAVGGLMPADDVTQDQPLRGGRQRANHIQVHRVELGAWERKRLDDLMPTMQLNQMVKPAVAILGAGSLAAIGIAVFMSGRTIWGWGEDLIDMGKSAINEATGGLGLVEPVIGAPTYERQGGGEYTNYLYPVPVLGSLFGSGINIGKALFED